ncbi:hypothetical protein BDV23DRAFT_63589 [Aspergillus alliaceus]|uniref:NAD(P)-binding domain-containing protein n=1 Tax=Petromyces alliaceus TaxID=209559 RepID=A0A5N7CC99_PETAA|nr:hypothetical protein BDV23DRAFT_63589 [Aspergillus alliaceus]
MTVGNLHIVAFFGATGGCVLACLVRALKAGIRCSALVRDPAKLHDLLRQRGLSETITAEKLSVVKGDVTDISAVQQTLRPRLDNPTICQDAVRTILAACRGLERKPVLVAISSVGLTDKKRDAPIAMVPLNYWALRDPHADKKVMEEIIFEEMKKPEAERAIRDYALVRPSWFINGEGIGLGGIRDGTEECPAIGYTISRNDVGLWIYENLVHWPVQLDNPYVGRPTTITA